MAKRLNISHLLGKKVSELSGGEIQRAMLAKSLADEPSVLLLDEPFANLDSLNKKRIILELIKVLKNETISCALVTHEIRDAFGIVDNLADIVKITLRTCQGGVQLHKFGGVQLFQSCSKEV